VDLTLTVLDPPPPVMIRRGEILRYRADFAIAANGPSQFHYWAEATLPNNQVRFLFGPITVNGTPGATVSLNLQQLIPNAAPLGDYVFRMKVGQYPGTVYDTDSFPVTVVAGEALAARIARQGAEGLEVRGVGRTQDARAVAHRRPEGRAAAIRSVVPPPFPDVPVEVARRIAVSPEAWLAWDEDGTVLEAGVVQDLRLAAARDEAERRDAGEADTARDDTGIAPVASEPVGEAYTTAVPASVVLVPPSPNPFTGRTTLRFALPAAAAVRLVVYDALGRRVAVLADGPREAGWHEATFDGAPLPAGVYVARLEAGDVVLARRLTVLR
jgi:hypothetical protein